MRNDEAQTGMELVTLAEKKLTYLHAFSLSIGWLLENLSQAAKEEIARQLECQQQYAAAIDKIDDRFQCLIRSLPSPYRTILTVRNTGTANHASLPEWCRRLIHLLYQQREALTGIVSSNTAVTGNVQKMLSDLKTHLTQFNRRNNAVIVSAAYDKYLIGNYLSYQEGKRV